MTKRTNAGGLYLIAILCALGSWAAGCSADDDDITGTAGMGGSSSAGKGGSSSAGKGGSSNAGEGSGSAGEDNAGSGNTSGHIEIAGSWENADFGEEDEIDDDSWSQTFGTSTTTSTIATFDNDDNYVIVEDGDGKFGRWVWTDIEDDSFNYCMVAFGLDSADDAESSPATADSDDLAKGCGGFPWTKLTKQ